jgi:hypothetical protein
MDNPLITRWTELNKYSDFNKAQEKAYKYLGENAVLFLSPKTDKKYRIYNPIKDKFIDFGQMGYEDYTKSNDDEKRERYLKRAMNIKGEWRDNKYSPNNLSINILW